jgi:hypothetical protein
MGDLLQGRSIIANTVFEGGFSVAGLNEHVRITGCTFLNSEVKL